MLNNFFSLSSYLLVISSLFLDEPQPKHYLCSAIYWLMSNPKRRNISSATEHICPFSSHISCTSATETANPLLSQILKSFVKRNLTFALTLTVTLLCRYGFAVMCLHIEELEWSQLCYLMLLYSSTYLQTITEKKSILWMWKSEHVDFSSSESQTFNQRFVLFLESVDSVLILKVQIAFQILCVVSP